MFRLGLAVVFAIFAGIQGRKAQKSISQAYSELRQHHSFPLLVALLAFLALLIVAGIVLSAIADVWKHANELGGLWFAVAILAAIVCLCIVIYFVARRYSNPARRRLKQNDDVLFVAEDLPRPLPPPGNSDARFERIRAALRDVASNPKAVVLKDADIEFLRTDNKRRELIEDELKRQIRNLVDAAGSESGSAGDTARRLADSLIKINPGQADWCRAELSTLKHTPD